MIPPWLQLALNERGVKEAEGPADNIRIVEYHATTSLKAADDEVPWCSSFVNWCVLQSDLDGTFSAAARSWLRWGVGLGHPALGCVVVLKRGGEDEPGPEVIEAPGHVGFYVGRSTPEKLLILGGNQSNEVNVSTYSQDRVLGLRWPSEGGS